MYVVKQIIEEHGGAITIRSSSSQGTVFLFNCPFRRSDVNRTVK